jgi:hypothetical protein
MCTVPEAWFLSTVKNDDIKIIKLFYGIPVRVYGTILHHDTICTIAYHAITDPKSWDHPTFFYIFYYSVLMDAENFATTTYLYTMVTTRKIFWSYIFGHRKQT